MAREFLSRHGIPFDAFDTGASPVGAAATLALVRERRQFHVKWDGNMLAWDQGRSPVVEGQLRRYFVHEDAGIRVLILVAGEVIVRGYDEETYRRVLGV